MVWQTGGQAGAQTIIWKELRLPTELDRVSAVPLYSRFLRDWISASTRKADNLLVPDRSAKGRPRPGFYEWNMKTERRHELKHNELADWLGKSIETVEHNYRPILGGVVVLGLVVGAFLYLRSESGHKRAEGWNQYFQA